jgi:outer membrane protein assembly factor BamB
MLIVIAVVAAGVVAQQAATSAAPANPGPPSFVSNLSHKPGGFDISQPLRSMKPTEPLVIRRIYDPMAGVDGEASGSAASVAVAGSATDESHPTDHSPRLRNEPAGEAPAATLRQRATTLTAPTWLGGVVYQAQGVTMPGYTITGEPPDTEGAVGKDYFVQLVNSSIAVFDKSGNKVFGPVNINTLFSGFPSTDGNRCSKNNDGDPIVYYDQLADRWILSQFDVTRPAGATSDYQCLAVSVSGDPTGAYYRWDYAIPGGMMGDYEKIGLWPDGYYMTIRAFNATSGVFQGSKCLIFDRSKLLVGAPDATQLDSGYLCTNGIQATPCSSFPNRTQDGFTPMSLDGFTPPPPAAANAIAKHNAGTSAIRFYWTKVNSNADGSWPAAPTVTVTGPSDVAVSAFTAAAQSTAIAQPGTTQKLDSLGNNLMYRMAYRNYGTAASPNERIVVNHSVTGPAAGQVSVKWYQFRNNVVGTGVGPTSAPVLVYDQRYAPDGTSRWMGSVAMDKRQNLGIGYNISNGTTVYPGIAINGRAAADAGALQGETVVQAGAGNNPSASRWGDYSQTSVDPIDDCTFWYTSEYFPSSGDFNWATAFVKFRYPDCLSCTPPATPTGVTGTQNSATSFTLNWNAQTGAGSYKVYRSLAACPQGTPTYLATCPGAAGCSANNVGYTDTTLVSGTTYYYSVTAIDSATGNCESLRSTCVSSVSGSCAATPSFAGAKSVDPYTILAGGVVANNSCSLTVTWDKGSSNCPLSNTVTYDVYRSTTSTFTPAAANRVASCIGGNSFNDTGITSGTTYYYIVHAEDGTSGNGGGCNGGNEDKNTVRLSGTPGAFTSIYYENFDSTAAGAVPANWTQAGQWRGAVNCPPSYSGTNTLHWGGSTCSGQYAINANDDATSPTITVPAGATQTRFSMWHRWNMAGTVRDGLHLRVSINGAAAIEIPTAAFLSGGYTGTRLSDNGDGCGTALPYANLGIWGGQQNTFTNTVLDMDQVCGGGTCAGKTMKFYFTGLSNCTATNDIGWFIDDVEVLASTGTCGTAPAQLSVLTATAASTQNTIEWLAGATGSRLQLRYRTDAFPTGPNDGTAVPGTPVTLTANAAGSVTHTGLTNGATYYYSAFVDTGAGTQTGNASSVAARPFASGGATQWVYNTGAASLTPPGIGSSSIYAVSNDRILHSMAPTGGLWPVSPSVWKPFTMNAPSQARPSIPTVLISGTPTDVVYLGSQDGNVYCINAATGAQVWRTASPLAPAGSLVQGAVTGMFTNYGGAYNLVFAGTRNASANNVMYAFDAATGTQAWSFNAGTGIGIITGDPWVEYASKRLYFTSRSRVGGSSGTLWCLDFTNAAATACSGFPKALGDIDGSASIFNGRVYVGNNSGRVAAVDATTGTTLWTFDTNDGPVKGFVNPDFIAGALPYKVFFATTTKLWALTDNGATASQTWSVAMSNPSVPIYDGNSLYVGSSNGSLYSINVTTGAISKSALLGAGDAAVGSPSLDFSNGRIYVGTDGGQVYATTYPLP